MSNRLERSAGWAAYLSGVAAIAGMVSLLLFFGIEAPVNSGQDAHLWGPLSDICPIIQMVSLWVVAFALYQMARPGAPGLSLIGFAIGIVGMLGVALLQFLLIVKVIPFEQEVGPVVAAFGAVGVWLVLVNYLGGRQKRMHARLAWLGIAVGAAFVLEPVLLSAMGGGVAWQAITSNYLLLAGSVLVFLIAYVGFPVWAIWLGRFFTASRRESAGQLAVQQAHAGGTTDA